MSSKFALLFVSIFNLKNECANSLTCTFCLLRDLKGHLPWLLLLATAKGTPHQEEWKENAGRASNVLLPKQGELPQ